MRREYIAVTLLISSVVFSILILVRRKNIKKASLAAFVAQLFTWPIGLFMTYFEKVEYPFRFFPKAADNSFIHGFVTTPAIFAIYYIHYPKQAKPLWKFVYTIVITAIPASMEVIENKYTNLVHYIAWNGYYTWALGLLVFFILRKYLDWFFKKASTMGALKNET